ncbi:MAG: hypothetical protein AB1801_08155 [Chloroflexota bacterium]
MEGEVKKCLGHSESFLEQRELDQSRSDRSTIGRVSLEQPRIPEIQEDRLAEAIRDIEKGYDPSARFETQLMLEGLLSRLEQAGILPTVENPNPYDPGLDIEQHDRWWEEHPQEAEKFDRLVDKRNEVLRHVYIGALIGSGPWNLP